MFKYQFKSEADVIKAASRLMERRIKRYSSVIDGACAAKKQVRIFLETELLDEAQEHFYVLYLDNQHALICSERVFSGTIDEARVWPREVARRCLEKNACAVVVAHNHPSGELEPSPSDIQLTTVLNEALGLFNIRLLDHIIVGAGESMSFQERGIAY